MLECCENDRKALSNVYDLTNDVDYKLHASKIEKFHLSLPASWRDNDTQI